MTRRDVGEEVVRQNWKRPHEAERAEPAVRAVLEE